MATGDKLGVATGFYGVYSRQNEKNLLPQQSETTTTVGQEACAGLLGGALSCWNHPFEVARIQMQSTADMNQTKQSMTQVFVTVYRESGIGGLFKGIIPRICLGMWQTLFMVSGAKVLTRWLDQKENKLNSTATATAVRSPDPLPAPPAGSVPAGSDNEIRATKPHSHKH